ncbi:MAG: pyruvate ferredoxin oxidoreductase [Clostridiales Family XIII bacterium]|jgi:pyruvate ferredoxin oxidoreductase alpha subunit|nr:pyruvate ferredoxin oxidoreductase [Clostridiales Family XIII bacterium]
MSGEKQFISGDEAVALAVKQAKPHVIAAYPITPQTIVVERLADYVEEGELESKYMYVESEHSALSALFGASGVGARTFTATSSQGLLYMAECLHFTSGGRYPIVMMNANRSLALPWSIFGDQRDSLSQRDAGWIQLYVENVQEAYDSIFHAYRIAEDPRVMTPVMVNLDGFILTHTYELLETLPQEQADAFIPYADYANCIKFDEENPMNIAITGGPLLNMEFRFQQQRAMNDALKVIEETDKAFGELTGRTYGGGLVEAYRCEDAEVVLLSLGSLCGTIHVVVDEYRKAGKKVGLLKLRSFRPFPVDKVAEALSGARAVGVVEKDISFGYEGAVYSEVNSALIKKGLCPLTRNYVGGLGGRNFSKEDICGMFDDLLEGAPADSVQFVNLRGDIDYGNEC